jgi:hypothetical protein
MPGEIQVEFALKPWSRILALHRATVCASIGTGRSVRDQPTPSHGFLHQEHKWNRRQYDYREKLEDIEVGQDAALLANHAREHAHGLIMTRDPGHAAANGA